MQTLIRVNVTPKSMDSFNQNRESLAVRFQVPLRFTFSNEMSRTSLHLKNTFILRKLDTNPDRDLIQINQIIGRLCDTLPCPP